MTLGALPHLVEVRTLAARGAVVEGSLAPIRMPRLLATIVTADTPARVEARFDRDEEGRYVLDLSVEMTVEVACQRCLAPLGITLASNSQLVALWSDDQAQHLPSRYDPLVTGDETDLWQVVEDELLLALPPFSYHEDRHCGTSAERTVPPDLSSEDEATLAKRNPFEVLARLKSESSERG